jgi:class 3 adenylate cyclase/pimeloyl-ACP methyl ester carboxylesterase
MPPRTRFARSGDVMVAFQVTGEENPVDVVWAPGVVSHLDLDWGDPDWAHTLERMGSFSRLIRFDKRGTGLSDRGIAASTLEERTDDIRAVMDAAGSERAVILGDSEGGCMACVFAATYPERTRGIVLWGTQARWVKTDDYPWGFDPVDHARIVASLADEGMTAEYLTGGGWGLGETDEAALDSAIRYSQAAASPTQMAALEQMNADMDIRDVLPLIRVPTLVLHRTGDLVVHPDAVRQMAESIPGARRIEFPGNTHLLVDPGVEPIIQAIAEFATGERPTPHPDRVLSTVLFTDIVDSTARAAAMGDAEWRSLLAKHDEVAHREVARHRGRYVNATGDGLLATFDGPARAVRCAQSIGDALRPDGVEIRAGCHTGEIELAGEDVRGIAVHTGARVAALATAGEVLVSRTVKDLVAGSGLQFEDRGTHELKGVPEPWQLFAVVR